MKNRQSMQALARYSPPRRVRPWVIGTCVVLVVAAAGAGAWYRFGRRSDHDRSAASAQAAATTVPVHFDVTATTPTPGAKGVASNAALAVRFSAPLPSPLPAGYQLPTLSPAVAGTWSRADRYTLQFRPSTPFVPGTTETLTIPGGSSGIVDAAGRTLAAPDAVSFQIAPGSEERLQQLLALTGYLPLSFTPSGPPPAPADEALPQAGTFAWRWSTLPAALTSLWVEGQPSQITVGAVMTVENQNGLAVDGIAGPEVWSTLLSDVAKGVTDQAPWDYVYVSKVIPENLTLWVDGVPKFSDVLVNTGVPGADTTDGTYEVFEHVTSSVMKGTNPDGTTYDDPDVPWASFFNGGDALHGFVRASYGFPQSNGCVEMPVATAGATWPYTPIGTLVTVTGPTAT